MKDDLKQVVGFLVLNAGMIAVALFGCLKSGIHFSG